MARVGAQGSESGIGERNIFQKSWRAATASAALKIEHRIL